MKVTVCTCQPTITADSLRHQEGCMYQIAKERGWPVATDRRTFRILPFFRYRAALEFNRLNAMGKE